MHIAVGLIVSMAVMKVNFETLGVSRIVIQHEQLHMICSGAASLANEVASQNTMKCTDHEVKECLVGVTMINESNAAFSDRLFLSCLRIPELCYTTTRMQST